MGLLSALGGIAGSVLGGGPIGGAIGSALGGVFEGDSGTSSNAANAANAGAQANIDLQRRMYEENVARQQPFYQAGVNALPGYLQGIGQGGDLVRGFTQADYQADPGYQFRLSEGQRALAHSAGGRGGLVSGTSLKAMQDYAQNSASAEYNNAYNRYRDTQSLRRNALAGVVGFAPTALSSMGAAGSNYAAGAGPQMYQQGVNTGNAMIAGNQANQSAYGNLGNALGKYLNNSGGGQYYNPTTNSGGFSGTSLANTFYSGTGGIGD
jgi:hypothetical protein